MIERINISEALRYMGHKGEISASFENTLKTCEDELLKAIRPQYTYKSFSIFCNNKGVKLEGSSLVFEGSDITEHLSGCNKAVLLCATIGGDVDKLIRLKEVSDISSAFIIDAMASAAVEQLCELVEKKIRNDFPNKFFTWRYSPGYGNFPLEIQQDFLNVLDAQKRAGICTSEDNLLVPRKSVTAVMGMSETQIEKKRRGCASCNMATDCQYRKRGNHCGF